MKFLPSHDSTSYELKHETSENQTRICQKYVILLIIIMSYTARLILEETLKK